MLRGQRPWGHRSCPQAPDPRPARSREPSPGTLVGGGGGTPIAPTLPCTPGGRGSTSVLLAGDEFNQLCAHLHTIVGNLLCNDVPSAIVWDVRRYSGTWVYA